MPFSELKFDGFVKSQKAPVVVIPSKSGIQENQPVPDSRFCGSNGLGDLLQDHQVCYDAVSEFMRRVKRDIFRAAWFL